MQEAQQKSRSGAFGIVSLVLAILAGLWSAIGAWIPGGFVGIVAAVLGFIARGRAEASGTARTVATLGLILGVLVLVASVVLVIADPSTH
jgi:hypothetical protein